MLVHSLKETHRNDPLSLTIFVSPLSKLLLIKEKKISFSSLGARAELCMDGDKLRRRPRRRERVESGSTTTAARVAKISPTRPDPTERVISTNIIGNYIWTASRKESCCLAIFFLLVFFYISGESSTAAATAVWIFFCVVVSFPPHMLYTVNEMVDATLCRLINMWTS